jgi:outer membrane protein assembly factor BamA
VYPDAFSFNPGLSNVGEARHFYNDDVGVGLRIVLPIGGGTPLRLDYGIPMTYEHGPGSASKWGRFQFGFGYSHPF